MRVSRLYVPFSLSANQDFELNSDNAHYVRTVLRLKANDSIILFDGNGGEYAATLTEVSKKCVQVKVGSRQERSVESPLHIRLGLGISRGDRMDWAVQKAVELGVNSITPILTERCVVQFKGEKKPQRWQHWQNIIYHAAEQSGRTMLPEFKEICPIQNWVNQQKGLKIFLDPLAEQSLAQLQPTEQQVTLLTGPEGGFSDQEREIAKASGFIPVRLGNRILRTETAVLAALSAVQMLWGDFGFRGQKTEDR